MIWFLIAIIVSVSFGFAIGVDDPEEGVASFLGSIIILGLLATAVNLLVGLGDYHREVSKQCNLEKVSSTTLAADFNDGNYMYYRCVGDSSFAPTKVDPYYAIVKHGDKATLTVKSSVKNSNWLSVFNVGGADQYVFTVPDSSITLGLDKSPSK